ncbi:MAG: hypothetical protein ACREM3_30260, partial [Candidatus Rokuibacteriota bacterium]
MLERIREFLGRRPTRGIVGSLAIHAAIVVVAIFFAAPPSRMAVKRGEPLFVELHPLPEPAAAGNPAARTPGPPAGPRPNAPEPSPVPARPAP